MPRCILYSEVGYSGVDGWLWAFHGDMNEAAPVSRSRNMIEAVRKAGGQPRYTEYASVGHNSWDRAYTDPELLPWTFKQRRAG